MHQSSQDTIFYVRYLTRKYHLVGRKMVPFENKFRLYLLNFDFKRSFCLSLLVLLRITLSSIILQILFSRFIGFIYFWFLKKLKILKILGFRIISVFRIQLIFGQRTTYRVKVLPSRMNSVRFGDETDWRSVRFSLWRPEY